LPQSEDYGQRVGSKRLRLENQGETMSIDLNLIKTIVVVMMENRSFDNLLGYLNLGPYNGNKLEGVSAYPAWLDKVASVYNATKYRPFLLTDPYHRGGR
jgi:hypothetical protein